MGHLFQNIITFFKRTKPAKDFEQLKHDLQIKYTDYSHLYNPDNTFTDEFYSNLSKTINWTGNIIKGIHENSEINFSTILRLTNPDYEGKPFYRYTDTWSGFAATPRISFNYSTLLNEALTVINNNILSTADINQLGQILEFDIDLTTHDGAPCAESEGFVDESDIPPIDTWFYITKMQLYCWIPNMFIEKMQGAIDVEILDSYRWIKDSNPNLHLQITDRLKATYN